MGHRDSLYQLSGTIELDNGLVGGRQKGKRGRGAAGKKNVMIACESKDKKQDLLQWPWSIAFVILAWITLSKST
jgi:hypothetical protein